MEALFQSYNSQPGKGRLVRALLACALITALPCRHRHCIFDDRRDLWWGFQWPRDRRDHHSSSGQLQFAPGTLLAIPSRVRDGAAWAAIAVVVLRRQRKHEQVCYVYSTAVTEPVDVEQRVSRKLWGAAELQSSRS